MIKVFWLFMKYIVLPTLVSLMPALLFITAFNNASNDRFFVLTGLGILTILSFCVTISVVRSKSDFPFSFELHKWWQ